MGRPSREQKLEGSEVGERIYMQSTDQATNKMVYGNEDYHKVTKKRVTEKICLVGGL